MRDLDETDMEILRLLAEDARRPFSEIGERVELSGPAVSDRVERLREAGIIKQFTIDVDRSQLRAGVPVLIRVQTPLESIEAARDAFYDADSVEHVFVTADGDIWCYARVQAGTVRAWIENVCGDVQIFEYTVTLIEETAWTPSVDGLEFALTCVECNNTVDSEGETARIDGEIYHFCCPSCLARFKERYRRIEDDV